MSPPPPIVAVLGMTDEDDTFEVGAQLTIEEIVNQRFEEAERRSGQIITILYDLLLVWVRLDTYRS
jgi:hypothetical protein